jgi:DegV family protein with EDD domain
MNIGIVTDSTSDLPGNLADQYGIRVVPAFMVINGQSLEDGHDISREELYRQLPGMETSPTTAAPSSGTFQEIYEALLDHGADQVLSIHVASSLSGICNSASAAAKSYGDRVQVVDSCHVTLGLGFQVLAAAQAALSGLTVGKILPLLEAVRRRTHLVAMLDTLEYVRRSGRVSWARSSLSSLFQIKPFIGINDGNVIRMGETRTRQKGLERLFKMLRELGTLENLAVLHTNADADALQFAERAKSLVKNQPLVVNVTPIIGVHVGPNGIGFVAVSL